MLRRYSLLDSLGQDTSATAPDWIFRNPKYKSWLENKKSCILWITGRLGCGKTTLLATMIKALRRKELVCYHFFGPEDSRQQKAHNFVRGFLYQIVCYHKELLRHFKDKYESRGDPILDDTGELWEILLRCLKDLEHHATIIIALDGLEKFSKREQNLVMEYLFEAISIVTCRIKMIVTSDAHATIRDWLTSIAIRNGSLSLETIDHDDDGVLESVKQAVYKYIDLTIKELPALSNWDQDRHERLGKVLKDRADGTYLWVSTILCAIPSWGDMSEQNLEKLLSDLPSDLNETYITMFKLLSDQSSMTNDLFKILLGAIEPLSLPQLNDCLAARSCMTSEAKPFDVKLPKARQPDIERTIKICCGSFVHTIDGFCYFVHSTARDFIFDRFWEVSYLSSEWESPEYFAEICGFYLGLVEFHSFPDRNPPSIRNLQDWCDRLTADYPFLVFCRRHWSKYRSIFFGSPIDDDTYYYFDSEMTLKVTRVRDLFNAIGDNLFLRVSLFLKPSRMAGVDENLLVNPKDISGVHLCAFNGSILSYERLTLPLLGYSPLHVAVLGKQVLTVQCLLENDRSLVEERDQWSRTPLHLASTRNAIELVELLMIYSNGGVVAKDDNRETPIDYAESCGLTDIAIALRSWRDFFKTCSDEQRSAPPHRLYLRFRRSTTGAQYKFSQITVEYMKRILDTWAFLDYPLSMARNRPTSAGSDFTQFDRSSSNSVFSCSVIEHVSRRRSSTSTHSSAENGSSSESSGLLRSASRGSSIDLGRRRRRGSEDSPRSVSLVRRVTVTFEKSPESLNSRRAENRGSSMDSTSIARQESCSSTAHTALAGREDFTLGE